MEFEAWNKNIAEHFFNPSKKGQQVFLYVTDEVLHEIAAQSFTTAGEAQKDFCCAVVAKASQNICQTTANWAEDSDWGAACNAKIVKYPPYLGFLAFFVLILTRENNLGKAGYYDKLNLLLKDHGYKGDRVTSLKPTEIAWENLQEWSQTSMDGKLGIFENRTIGGFEYVGRPKAQALVSPADTRRLSYFFARFDPNNLPDKNNFKQSVYQNRATCLTQTTANLLTAGDHEIAEAILRVGHVKLQEWKNSGAPIYLKGNLHKTKQATPAVGPPTKQPITCLVASYWDEESGRVRLCVYAKCAGIENDLTKFSFSHEGKHWELPRVWNEEGLYGPAGTTEAYFEPPDLDYTYFFLDQGNLQRDSDCADALRFMDEPRCVGSWVELEPGDLVVGNSYRVLANTTRAQAIGCFLEKNNAKEIQVLGLANGWSLYEITYKDGLGLVPAAPNSVRTLKSDSGIRTTSGNTSAYFDFAPPLIRRELTGGVVAISSTGLKQRLVPSNGGNLYQIPKQLRTGELTLFLADSKGTVDGGINSRTIRFAPPSMPEVYGFENNPFQPNSTGYSGAFFEETGAPTFLCDYEDVKLVFESQSEFRGPIRTYKPGGLPAVRLERPAHLDVQITCDGVAVEIGENGFVKMPAAAKAQGVHKLECLWLGGVVCDELFEIREIPRISCVSHQELANSPNGHRVFLKSSTPIVLTIDPMEPGIRLVVDGQSQVVPRDGTVNLHPIADEFRLYLVWRGLRVHDGVWHFIEQPRVKLCIEGQPLNGPASRSFRRSQLPLLHVLQPQGEPLVLKCFGIPCKPLAEQRFKIPENLPANTNLIIKCVWRDREIDSFVGPNAITIKDSPEIRFVFKGGKPIAHANANCFLQASPPGIRLQGELAGIKIRVIGKTFEVDSEGKLHLPPGTLVEGDNNLAVEWHGEIIGNPAVLRLMPGPKCEIDFVGGNLISPPDTLPRLYVLSAEAGLPDVNIVRQDIGEDGLMIRFNGSPVMGNQLPASDSLNGDNELEVLWGETTVLSKKKIMILKDYYLIGAQPGQVATNEAAPEWDGVWVISKLGRDSFGFPKCPNIQPPIIAGAADRGAAREWKNLLLHVELYPKVMWSSTTRQAWKEYRGLARRIR